jgi:phosphotransferase system  glucose/maltose/N-acetylglucosamine-specific IIC component
MIALGGLLLVVPQLFVIMVLVSWVGFQESKLLNLDVKNIFIGSHIEH